MTGWKFWVITGIDYSGKTTILREIAKKKFSSLHWSDLKTVPWIKPVLERPYDIVFEMGKMSRASFILLVASTMFEVMMRKKIVLVDSYWYRFYVKEKIFGLSELEILKTLFKLPRPVKVFYVELPPEEAYIRSRGVFTRYESFDNTKEGFLKFQEILDKELRILFKELGLAVNYLNGKDEVSKNVNIIIDELTKELLL
ncbi:MAG: hypothetical protein DRZ80_06955 [Thermoprotei archaeon]|nr:MAG: hypothetical protein DRZ80_06955 [Thermoprotei archaeon]